MPTYQSFLETTLRTPGQFVQVPVTVLTDDDLSAGAKLFLAQLLRWDWGGGCWLTDKQLAHALNVSERTIRNHTKALEEAGHLWVFEDREGMTVRLVVRPGRVYPRPACLRRDACGRQVGMGAPKAGKIFSSPEPRHKVLNHGLEVHVLPTAFEVELNSIDPTCEPEEPVVCAGESIVDEKIHTEAPETEPKQVDATVLSEADLVKPDACIPDTVLTCSAPMPPDVEALKVPGAPCLVEELTGIGMVRSVAEDLVQKVPPAQIRAAIRYVSGYRGEVLNPPGLLRHLLETAAKLPRWCYPAEPRRTETPIEARSPEAPDFDPPSEGERDRRRAASPHAELWGRVSARLEGMMQRQSFKTWFVPAFIDRIEAGAVVLNVPSVFHADWIEEHYTETIAEALRAEGVVVERVEVEV